MDHSKDSLEERKAWFDSQDQSMVSEVFVALIQERNPNCTCETCQPELHTRSKKHHNSVCLKGKTPPKLNMQKLGKGIKIPSLDLAQCVLENTRQYKSNMRSIQKRALQLWRDLEKEVESKGSESLLQRLGTDYPAKVVSTAEVNHILGIIYLLFFQGRLRIKFEWVHDLTSELGNKNGVVLGCSYLIGHSTTMINLDDYHTVDYSRGVPGYNEKALSRLDTLLHEALHAFFEQFSCSCSKDINLDRGHGRAFQRAALCIEKAAKRWLGFELEIDGVPCYIGDWLKGATLCSNHDVEQWEFRRSAYHNRRARNTRILEKAMQNTKVETLVKGVPSNPRAERPTPRVVSPLMKEDPSTREQSDHLHDSLDHQRRCLRMQSNLSALPDTMTTGHLQTNPPGRNTALQVEDTSHLEEQPQTIEQFKCMIREREGSRMHVRSQHLLYSLLAGEDVFGRSLYSFTIQEVKQGSCFALTAAVYGHLRRLEKDFCPCQKAALQELRAMVKCPKPDSLLRRLGMPQTDTQVSVNEMEVLINLFSRLYLPFHRHPDPDFHWTREIRHEALGMYLRGSNMIKMDPEPVPQAEWADVRHYNMKSTGHNKKTHQLLSTLLHELSHAFLERFACKDGIYWSNIGMGGHGRVWQLIGLEIESQTMRLLNMSLDLTRGHSLLQDFNKYHLPLPSTRDLNEYDWPEAFMYQAWDN